jgi:hypothetical protein
MSDWTLCIDFGTAYSKAAVAPTGAWSRFDPASVRPLMLSADGQNTFLLDSAVFVDEDRVLFGRAALNEADAQADNKRAALRSFKTLLSVSDLDRALNTNAPATIDPHRVFQMRDLIVLYLAYLLASIERAITADPILAQGGSFSRRYAAPAWRSGDSAGMHDVIVRLFGEAEAFRALPLVSASSGARWPCRCVRSAKRCRRRWSGPKRLRWASSSRRRRRRPIRRLGLEGSGSHHDRGRYGRGHDGHCGVGAAWAAYDRIARGACHAEASGRFHRPGHRQSGAGDSQVGQAPA